MAALDDRPITLTVVVADGPVADPSVGQPKGRHPGVAAPKLSTFALKHREIFKDLKLWKNAADVTDYRGEV